MEHFIGIVERLKNMIPFDVWCGLAKYQRLQPGIGKDFNYVPGIK